MATPSESLTLCKVLSESSRIIRSHRPHFQALTLLFVFPPSLCTLIYPTLIQKNHLLQSDHPTQYLLLNLLYTLFVTVFSLFSAVTISYSAYHGFHGEPVDLIASIKSIKRSFWPLVSTSVVLSLFVVLVAIPPVLLAFLVYKWLHSSSYFIPFVIFISLTFVLVSVILQVNWILASVIVVVESKWGYAPLKRSAYLIEGNRGVIISMLLFFWLANGVFFWGFSVSWSMNGWTFLLYVIIESLYLSCILLLMYVAMVVLYVYCRDSHEGLPFQNSNKFPLLK